MKLKEAICLDCAQFLLCRRAMWQYCVFSCYHVTIICHVPPVNVSSLRFSQAFKFRQHIALQTLQDIIEYSVNMELDFSVIMGNEDQSWMKYLQYQLKYLLTEIKEERAAISKLSVYLGKT